MEFLDYVVLIKHVPLAATLLAKARFNRSVWWGCVTQVPGLSFKVGIRSGFVEGSRH